MENWKRIDCLPNYGGIVEVSDAGRVRVRNRRYRFRSPHGVECKQTKPDQIISGEIGTHGYRIVSLYVQRKRHKFLVHRLVATAFVPGFKPGLTVNHINGCKTDNRRENLEWVSISENTRKQWETGLVDNRGERNPNTKLTDQQISEIVERLKDPNVVFRRLAAEYNISDSLIYKIRKGRRQTTPPRTKFMPRSP